eukprot:TRINITY_DN39035_c0_g1_i1.p2 TRINITY_DN39035_c0_g1~~TRINITY_DN39035_c0_g1_i1.p2  ORF type:complete len:112 (+),score=36.49 TRINITY_DN39035_c0_g1_i1:39-374(+)
MFMFLFFFFQAEDGIRDAQESRGLGDVYKRQDVDCVVENGKVVFAAVSDNFDVHPPYLVEVGGLSPSALKTEEHAAVLSLPDDFVSAYGNEVHAVLPVSYTHLTLPTKRIV